MNYGITKKQWLAIVESVRHFRGVLQGHPLTILTDHQPLVGFMSSLQTNLMMIRWQESLTQLDINIQHMESKENVIADARSRSHKVSPSPSSKQSPLSTDQSNSTAVLLTRTTQHLAVNRPTSTTLPSITTMPSLTTTRRRMTNMTGRNEVTDQCYTEDWELKINTESDESSRACGPTQQLRTEAPAARGTSNNITTEQVNQILQGARHRR